MSYYISESGIRKVIVSLLLFGTAMFAACRDKIPVEPPEPTVVDSIEPINGGYYTAVMGTSTTNLPVIFEVYDTDVNPMTGQWVKFSIEGGDGTLSAESLATDDAGQVQQFYTFDGALGNAEIRAGITDVDSVTVSLRANTLRPGSGGQAQYVLFTDRYIDTKHYNGEPERIDIDPYSWILYAVYESTLGVVLVIQDVNHDSVAMNNAEVLSVIVNSVYAGKTADSLGIGSTLSEFRAVYGEPDTIKYDGPAFPPIYIRYLAEGLTLYGALSAPDTVIHEIHLTDIGAAPPTNDNIQVDTSSKTSTLEPTPNVGYRLFEPAKFMPKTDNEEKVFQP